MNISDAKCLEYTLSLFKEYLSNKLQEDVPTYDIVWSLNNQLISGKLLRWDASHRLPVKTYVTKEFEPINDPLSIDKKHKDLFPRNIRQAWFDKYEDDWFLPSRLYKNKEMLLIESINFVSGLRSKQIKDIQNRMINVHYLQSNTYLPFLLLKPETELYPVSLIEVSKN